MLGVLLVPPAIFQELDPLFGILFIFCRRVIFSLTLGTNQRYYILHKTSPNTQTLPFSLFQEKN
jgi:hypothetical protein